MTTAVAKVYRWEIAKLLAQKRTYLGLGAARIGFTALVPETASLEELFLGMTGGESSDHDRAEAVAV